MLSVELWLVRHGQTEHNAQGQLSGWTDVALTDLGREQARWLKQHLEQTAFDSVWSSDLSRAKDTARLAWGGAFKSDGRLREIHFGDLEGQDFYSLNPVEQDALLAFDDFCSPGGESVADLEKRVTAFLDPLAPGRHLLFTHGGVIRSVMHQLTQTQRFVPNGALVVVDWSQRALKSVLENALTPAVESE